MLGDEKKLAKTHNMTIKECKFPKNQAVFLIEKGNDLKCLIKSLQKKDKNRLSTEGVFKDDLPALTVLNVPFKMDC